ncbi:MAG: Uma2 family endonuclease [Prochlorotrichaceae cyanobacterium]
MIQQLDPRFFEPDLLYPESDGKPVADNTLQLSLMIKIQGGLDSLFIDDPDVFVAGDLFWYPVQGSSTRQAPDIMVVFGCPKGHRRSYKQWEENNIAPQVVFEILSKSNTRQEMEDKLAFYDRYGVLEYYLYDPQKNRLKGWVRAKDRLTAIVQTNGWVSPQLGVRLENSSGDLELYRPDGKRFESFVEIAQRAEQEAQRAEQEAQARYSAIDRLFKLGLSLEQVAEALGFSIEQVNTYRENHPG